MKKILIPDLGDIGEVDVIEIPIEVGDQLQQEDTMVVLESEKATMEVPIPESGTIKDILLKVGDKVNEGDAVLMLEVEQQLTSDEAVTETTTKTVENEVDNNSASNLDVKNQGSETTPNQHPESSSSEVAEASEQPLVIPDIGDLEDVEVIEIQIKAGDKVSKEQTLVVLESEKASMDVPAPMDGEIVSLSVAIGDTVNSGTQIGVILGKTEIAVEADDTAISQAKDDSSTEQSQTVSRAEPVKPPVPERPAIQGAVNKNIVHASPGVRRYARELGADISKIRGSGPKSRVLKSDVKQFIKDELSLPRGVSSGGISTAALPAIDHSKYGEVEEVPLTRIQKFSSSNLHRNWVTIPHVTQFEEADITEMEAFRQSMKQEAAAAGVKITPLAFMLKAVATTLQSFPTFNSSLSADGESLILKKYIHIGVAVDTPNGLVVPVLRDVDKKNLYELANELGEISVKAREGKLSPASMKGSCFSISSLGGIGGSAFTPIVNWPDVAILGVSKSQMKPIWNGEEFQPRLMLPLSLSYDHRVIDGAVAARFSGHLAKVLGDIRRILL